MLRKTRMEFAVAVNVSEQFLFTCVRLKSDKKSSPDLCFELEHDPTLYDEALWEPVHAAKLCASNTMSLFAVDSSSGILKSIRFFTTPVAWHEIARSCWTGRYRTGYSARYQDWLRCVRSGDVDAKGFCPFPGRVGDELSVTDLFQRLCAAGFSGNTPQFYGNEQGPR